MTASLPEISRRFLLESQVGTHEPSPVSQIFTLNKIYIFIINVVNNIDNNILPWSQIFYATLKQVEMVNA